MSSDRKFIKFKFKHIWAKKREENGKFLWLSLEQHLLDTLEVGNLLWHHWLSEGQRQIVISSINNPADNPEDIANNLVKFLCSIHDLGKATFVFQTKKGFQNSNDLDISMINNLTTDGFENLFDVDLANPEKSPHALAGQAILVNRGVKDDLASIIGGHHGKPIESSLEYNNQLSGYASNYYQSYKENHNRKLWHEAQNNIIDWSLNMSGFKDVQSLPTINLNAQVILQGIVIMADWIASNENYYPLIELDSDIEINQKQRKEQGWLKWQKTYPDSMHSEEVSALYRNRFGFNPNGIQEKIYKITDSLNTPGLIIIEAPMGSGKTEAALIAAEQLASKFGQHGIFFGLPTQATSNGIFPRIDNWLRSISDERNELQSIQLVHGKAALNDKYSEIKNSSINLDQDATVISNPWFQGKKTAIMDDYVVGTVDQALMMALKQKHLALRHLGFSKKIVIIDEVHAYDSYMNQYLNRTLEWLAFYNVPVILLSATLPGKSRAEYVKSYLYGQGIKLRNAKLPENLDKEDKYPLVTYTSGEIVKQESGFEENKRKKIYLEVISDDELLDIVKELFKHGGIVGVIVNTVKRSQDLALKFTKCFGEDNVDLLHSNFIATERSIREQKILESIGKNGYRPTRKIVIGTQVIEQSLDIDFDVLISDHAPMDLLIQRAGRLHRHTRLRPANFEEAKMYILGMSEDYIFEPGSEHIYGEYLLIRTQYFLEKINYILDIPTDISHLVQKTYGDEKIDLDISQIQKYQAAEKKFQEVRNQKEYKANIYRLGRVNSQQNLIGWLSDTGQGSEERGNAQVRDSEVTIEVIVAKKMGEGYSIFSEDVDISQDIMDFDIAKRLSRETLRLPIALSKPWNIENTIEILEKYNKKYLSNWQSQPWLKGSLGIILDENNSFYIGDYTLQYDENLGLISKKVDKNGKI